MTDLGLNYMEVKFGCQEFHVSKILVPVVFGGIRRDFSIKIFQSYQGPTTSLHDKELFQLCYRPNFDCKLTVVKSENFSS